MSQSMQVTTEAISAALASLPSSTISMFGQQVLSYGRALQEIEEAKLRAAKVQESLNVSIGAIVRLMVSQTADKSDTLSDEDILKLQPDDVLDALEAYPADHWRILTSERAAPGVLGGGTCTFFHECTRHGYNDQILAATFGGRLPEGDIRIALDSHGRTVSSFASSVCLPTSVTANNVIDLLKAFPTYWTIILSRGAVDNLGRNLQTAVIFVAAANGMLDEIEAVLKELIDDDKQIEQVLNHWRDPNAMSAREIDQARKAAPLTVQTYQSAMAAAGVRMPGGGDSVANGG